MGIQDLAHQDSWILWQTATQMGGVWKTQKLQIEAIAMMERKEFFFWFQRCDYENCHLPDSRHLTDFQLWLLDWWVEGLGGFLQIDVISHFSVTEISSHSKFCFFFPGFSAAKQPPLLPFCFFFLFFFPLIFKIQ